MAIKTGGASGIGQQQTLIDGWWNWAYQVLHSIGAPTTPTNIATLWNWSIKESGRSPLVNGSIHNNPLNTTQPAPGSTSANSVGVQSYPDISTGATATAQTLLNGYYPDIVSALRNSVPSSQWGTIPGINAELDKWGSGSNWLGWNNKPPQPSSQFQNTTQTGSGVSDTSGGNPITDAINAALSPVGNAITGATNTLVEKATYGSLIAVGALLMLAGFGILVLPFIGSAGARAIQATPQGRAAGAVTGAVAASKAPAQPAPAPAPKPSPRPAAAPARAPQTRQERNAQLERGISEGRSLESLRRRK